jgi:tetratricopeptide (TPR) repeat protein
LPLYLHGWALARGGQAEPGQKYQEQAHLLPLGDSRLRSAFAGALERRGHRAAARREYDLLCRVGTPALIEGHSLPTGEGLRAAGAAAAARKDYLRAALGHEQAMLNCLNPYVQFSRAQAYVGVPALVHHLRARGLLAAGKVEEALGEAALAQAAFPGGVEMTVRLVPALEGLGRKREAAALFEQTLKVYEGLCRDYPRAASAHNSYAWVSAGCRRNLDKALEHALKAVELSPNDAAPRDTLAEVYFQLGKKGLAVAAQKKAIALDPKRAYFRKQLKRLEAGDPKAGRPEEDED